MRTPARSEAKTGRVNGESEVTEAEEEWIA